MFNNLPDPLKQLPADVPFLEIAACLSKKDKSICKSTFSSSNRKEVEQGVGGITGIDVTLAGTLSNMYKCFFFSTGL